jgi:hypothetical protein
MRTLQPLAPAGVRRRSGRLTLAVPVIVWGHRPDRRTFFEETRTLSVAANGGLLVLDSPVKPNQRMVVFNRQTQQELGCRVVHVREEPDGRRTVGITFEEATPNFWQVTFPPGDR